MTQADGTAEAIRIDLQRDALDRLVGKFTPEMITRATAQTRASTQRRRCCAPGKLKSLSGGVIFGLCAAAHFATLRTTPTIRNP